jgi:hypothetical protein
MFLLDGPNIAPYVLADILRTPDSPKHHDRNMVLFQVAGFITINIIDRHSSSLSSFSADTY